MEKKFYSGYVDYPGHSIVGMKFYNYSDAVKYFTWFFDNELKRHPGCRLVVIEEK